MKGFILGKMAWRNLWRNRRRTIVTLSSIVFGFMLAILFTGLGDDTYAKMIDLAARLGGGHVTIQHAEYLSRPSLKRTVTGLSRVQQIARRDPAVVRTVTRISGYTMLATAGNNFGASFIAVDPQQEDPHTLSVLEGLVEGEFFRSAKGRGIILGQRLAHNLGLRLGRKVVYTLTDKHGEIVTALARVTGIVRTGAPSLDGGLCLLPLGTIRQVLGYGPDESTQLALFLADNRQSNAVAQRLSPQLGRGVSAVPWRESQPELAGFISMKVGASLFFEILIGILVAAGIFNTLFVSVMERIREFGIMTAIGFSPGQLFRLVIWESVWVGLLGLIGGALVTALPYSYLNRKGIDLSAMVGQGGSEVAGVSIDPNLRVAIYPEHALFIAAAVLLATLLSGLYPAWKAGRAAPVESIKLGA